MEKGRIVVKIGSSSLANRDGSIAHDRLIGYTKAMSALYHKGYEIILISSGAVAAGFQKIGYRSRPATTVKKQAAAAVGQGLLMEAYQHAFMQKNISVAQLLLTRESFQDEQQYNNAYATLAELLKRRVIPIINENDSIAIDELTFGDNDWLSSLVAGLLHADMLILLTDVNGVYDRNPTHQHAKRFDQLSVISKELFEMTGSHRSSLGTGGMRSKLEAAKRAQSLGIRTFIGQAAEEQQLLDVVHDCGDGTYVEAAEKPWTKDKQWVGLHSPIEGEITIDNGAKEAMLHHGKSLLAVGVEHISKSFTAGAVIAVYDEDDLPVGKGKTSVSSQELQAAIDGNVDETMLCIHRNHWVSHQKGR